MVWGARAAAAAVEEPVAVEPQARVIPGLADAQAALLAAQEKAADLALRIQRQEAARSEAVAARARLLNRISNGAEVEPAEVAAATNAIAEAEARATTLQEAATSASAEVRRAEQGVARVLRDECKRLGPLAMAEGMALQQRGREMLELGGTLQTRGAELQRIGTNTAATPDDVRATLAHAARVGIA